MQMGTRKRNRKRKLSFVWNLILGIAAGFAAIFWYEAITDHFQSDVYSEQYVSIAEIKGELSFGAYAQNDWDTWFDSYRKEYLTIDMLRGIVEQLGVRDYIEIPQSGKSGAVTRAAWNNAYGQILDYLDMEQEVSRKNVLVLNGAEAENGVLITNQGDFFTELPISCFEQWSAYEVYVIGEECVGIFGVSDETQGVENVYLKSREPNKIVFLYDGSEYDVELGKTETELTPGVCDLVFQNGILSAVRVKKETIRGELISYDETMIEIGGYLKMGHPKKLPVYQTYGEVTEKSISDVVLGNMEVEYIAGDDQICAILIRQPAAIENIRVLLLASDGGKFRNDVYLKCNTPATLQCGETQTTVEAGKVICAADYEGENTAVLSPETQEGQIFICKQDGTPVSNGYYGSMETRKFAQGFVLVNSLPLETYLCAVVPSEMPSSYEPEALKAQAVCARSYAYIQLLRADLAEYGANIDDSTAYQVYNKVAPSQASVQAVQETAGKVLTYQGNIIEAYYFSTSMGYTGTADIWNIENLSDYAYLQSVCLNTDSGEKDLSEEAVFLEYIKKKANGYDSDVKYSRWFAQADYREKTAQINEILTKCRNVSEQNVLCEAASGRDFSEVLASMGSVIGVSVKERSSCGAMLTLDIQYEKGNVLVKSEYNIRQVLGCGVTEIVYADGSSGGVSLLPSAYCAVTEQENGTVLLQGGGYGHGLGMSQNGANGMAKAGMDYEEILKYFYKDVEIDVIQ